MDISGEYTFDAPKQMVWDAVRDPDVLGSILPGGEGIEAVGENEYAGKLKVKMGPVQGTFAGNIKLENIDAPNSYDILVDGKGAPGFVKANGSLKLDEAGEQTLMTYSGTAQVGGRIASVGQRLMDSSAKAIINQSLLALNEYLKVKMAQEEAKKEAAAAVAAAGDTDEEVMKAATSVNVPEYVPPTQAELARNVARDVASDMISPQMRTALYIIGGIIVALILYFLLT